MKKLLVMGVGTEEVTAPLLGKINYPLRNFH